MLVKVRPLIQTKVWSYGGERRELALCIVRQRGYMNIDALYRECKVVGRSGCPVATKGVVGILFCS